jgi:geranylgeranyl diphosphate synthase type II
VTALPPSAIAAELARYAAVTRSAMEEFLVLGRPSEYLYELIREYPDRGGKGIRPAILLATCQAYGGQVDEGVRAAVSLEMLHNAFLIHDDIEDNSPLRRGLPTLHDRHGLGLALNAGDALAGLALQPVRADSGLTGRLRDTLISEFSTVIRHTTEGQALELGWRRDEVADLVPSDYIELAGKKTCWYTTVAPLRMGAIIGSHGMATLGALSRFGFYLGLAFQTRDDLLDVERDSPHGKAPLGDIREGKHTLLLIHLMTTIDIDERSWLADFLRTSSAAKTAADCARVLSMMEQHGSVDFAREFEADMAAAARAAVGPAFAEVPPSAHVDFLRGLVEFVVDRRS